MPRGPTETCHVPKQCCKTIDSMTAGVCPAPSQANCNDLGWLSIRLVHEADCRPLACRCSPYVSACTHVACLSLTCGAKHLQTDRSRCPCLRLISCLHNDAVGHQKRHCWSLCLSLQDLLCWLLCRLLCWLLCKQSRAPSQHVGGADDLDPFCASFLPDFVDVKT